MKFFRDNKQASLLVWLKWCVLPLGKWNKHLVKSVPDCSPPAELDEVHRLFPDWTGEPGSCREPDLQIMGSTLKLMDPCTYGRLTAYFIATTSINDFWFLGAKEEKWLHLCCDPAVILAISKASQSHHFFSVQVWIWFSQYVPLLALIYIWIADFTNDRNH